MRIATLLSCLVLFATVGCGEKKAKPEGEPAAKPAPTPSTPPPTAQPDPTPAPTPPATVELVATDLSPAGAAATMKAPQGAKVEEQFGAVEVALADHTFHVEIHGGKADLTERKAEIAENELNKLKGYVVDEAGAVLYESEVMGKNEFHLLVNVDGGEAGWACEDAKGPSYTRAQAQTMFDACKSITAK
jgi:hypothetical protein